MNSRILISKKLVAINSASSLVAHLLNITVLIWVQQYLLKHIPVEEYSLLPVIYSVMIFLPFFVVILGSGIKRYVTEAYANNKDDRVTQIVSTMFPLLSLGSLFLIIIGGVLAWKIDTVLKIDPMYVDDVRIMLMLIIMLDALRLSMDAFSSGLYVQQRFVLESFIKTGCQFVRVGLLFALLLGVSTSVVSVVIATVVAGLLEIIVIFVVSRRLLPSQRYNRSKFDWSIVRELTKFGGWSSLYGFSGMLRKTADPIILNHLSTPLDVTCFHLGSLIPNRLEVIVNQSFLSSVSPLVIGLHVKRQDQKLKNIYLRIGRFTMWGVLLVISPFLVHYEQIVTLYVGTSYLSAGTVMFLLLACYPIIYGNALVTILATAKIRMRSLAIIESSMTAVNLSLTLLLVGYYQLGAVGAATATFIVYGLGSILCLWPFGKSLVNVTWKEVFDDILLPGIIPLLSATGMMMLLAISYPVVSWLDIAINAMLGSSVYLFMLWFVAKDIDKSQFMVALGSFVDRKLR